MLCYYMSIYITDVEYMIGLNYRCFAGDEEANLSATHN